MRAIVVEFPLGLWYGHVDVEVDVDVDRSLGCLKGVAKSVPEPAEWYRSSYDTARLPMASSNEVTLKV